jgi:hypothetical protein
MHLPPMHFTLFPAVKCVKTDVQTMNQVYLYILLFSIYWDILVYTVTYHLQPPWILTPKISTSSYVSDVETCIHLPPMHIAMIAY